ncbi:flagellar type III secretion system protein FliR [Vagococcus sp. DIV0080]|uniref:Flagellar biosynthetic protein FliR n=1 Tax=Candidatus Vagococcus giribetii TaxID=2230876 RepID=A0ABS3HVU0_9ENTE|nr:flagellar biosynthetic protein FliR [Vagococcus sp. DIV0080]MBO0476961.1 flagellar type III secretion system protein FliR [Vagococcus sp. DIV0080]
MNSILITFILIFARISSFMVTSPGFSLKQAPIVLKVGLSFFLSVIVYSMIPEKVGAANLIIFSFLVIKEILVGIALGFVVQLIFSSIEMAGQLIDFQVGFSMGSVYDPSVGIQASNYGRLYYWIALVLFFLSDMHHIVLQNLINSFQMVPLNEAGFMGNTVEGIIRLFIEMFQVSFMLAAPVVLVAFVTDCVLGIVSRSVPQINVLMLGMPMKILVSFIFILLFLPNFMQLVTNIFPEIDRYMKEFLDSLVR